ncbi:MAG TPA: heme ABC exporter ATP-binding protein CcmA [Thermaerobacter sp.]
MKRQAAASPPARLEAVDLERRFGDRPVFRHVNWRLGPGEIGVVLGPNGAGKTTLLQVLAGLLVPTAGQVRVDGHPVGPDAPGTRRLIGYIGHRPLLYPELTVLENLLFYGRLYGLPASEAKERALAALRDDGLDFVAEKPVRELSRGTVQRVEAVRALLHRPALLLWDEPFTGLDPAAADRLEDTLVAHRARGGTAVVVLHDVDRALRLADRVLVLAGGRARQRAAGELSTAEIRAWLAGRVADREAGSL